MKKILLTTIVSLFAFSLMAQDCSELFISEYVEGSGNNRAIEIYNPTNKPIDLSDYQLVRYRNGGFTPNPVVLSGVVEPKGTFVVVADKRNPNGTGFEVPVDSALQEKADLFVCPVYEVNPMMYFDGNDGVTLEKVTGEIVDIVCKIGPPITEDDTGWGNITDTTITWNNQGNPEQYTISDYIVGPLFWLSWTENQTLVRKPSVRQGVTQNPDVFMVHMEWDSLPRNTFDSLGFHHCDCNVSSVGERDMETQVTIYPNPIPSNQFKLNSEVAFTRIEVITLQGKPVHSIMLSAPVFEYNCTLDRKLSGIHFVRLTLDNDRIATRKLIFR
jgi:hypothetical protein